MNAANNEQNNINKVKTLLLKLSTEYDKIDKEFEELELAYKTVVRQRDLYIRENERLKEILKTEGYFL